MSTYSQKDYVTGIQATQPDVKFDLQLLQAKETAYKANKQKVSELYGSILDSDVTRNDSQAAKDEFFKTISQDIKQLGNVDFSLDSNVEGASKMFESIYTNKHLLKDMVWTKNFQNQASIGQSLKNCIDPEKCGGQWWEEGDKALEYKRMEFMNANPNKILSFANVQYTPYVDVNSRAMKLAKEKFIGVKKDAVEGNYIVTHTNGALAVDPLTALFNESIGKDPAVKAMYETKAYVGRMDEVHSMVARGEAASFEEAQVKFYEAKSTALDEQLQEKADALGVSRDYLKEKVQEDEELFQAGKIKRGTKEYEKALQVRSLYQNSVVAQEYIDLAEMAKANINNQSGLDAINQSYDTRASVNAMFDDIHKTAEAIAYSSEGKDIKESDFAKIKMKAQYDIQLEREKNSLKKDYALWKKENGISDDGDGSKAGKTEADIAKVNYAVAEKKKELATFDYAATFQDNLPTDLKGKTAPPKGNDDQLNLWNAAKRKTREAHNKIKREANAAVINSKRQDVLIPYPEAISDPDQLTSAQRAVYDNYWTNILKGTDKNNNYAAWSNQLKKKGKTWQEIEKETGFTEAYQYLAFKKDGKIIY